MAKGPVEIWLLDLLKMQMSSLHNIIRSAFYQISDSGFQLLPFLNHFPAQVRLHNIQRAEIRGQVFRRQSARRCGAVLCVLVAQSCSTLCDPLDCSSPSSSVHGILQAGILEWVAIPFSKEAVLALNKLERPTLMLVLSSTTLVQPTPSPRRGFALLPLLRIFTETKALMRNFILYKRHLPMYKNTYLYPYVDKYRHRYKYGHI